MTSRFTATRVTRTRIQAYAAPPDIVFPLHGFREEREWAVGWEPRTLYPPDGAPTDGAVFTLSRDGAEETWVLARWDPSARRAHYVHVTPGRDVTEIRVQVTGSDSGPSRVDVTYLWTGLSPEGNAFVEQQTEEHFDAWMREWEEEMSHYLRTGTKLVRPAGPAPAGASSHPSPTPAG